MIETNAQRKGRIGHQRNVGVEIALGESDLGGGGVPFADPAACRVSGHCGGPLCVQDVAQAVVGSTIGVWAGIGIDVERVVEQIAPAARLGDIRQNQRRLSSGLRRIR